MLVNTMVSPSTPELDESSKQIERTGGEDVSKKHSGGEIATNVYTIATGDPDVCQHTREVNAVSIGCPECKSNSTALVHGGMYHCVCGYESECSPTTLLLQGTMVEGTWHPY